MRHPALAFALLPFLVAGCADTSRSRNTADPRISAITIAQQVCSNCHGVNGISISPNFPILAAQTPTYLLNQLMAFKSHGREDPAGFEYMWGLSRSLSDEQMRGLADYFGAQGPAPTRGAPRGSDPTRGEGIYRAGLPDQGVPACAACHGDKGQGNDSFPRLAGQHSDYLIKQLTVFQQTDQRPAGVAMKAVTHDLRPADMRDVAAFLQAAGH